MSIKLVFESLKRLNESKKNLSLTTVVEDSFNHLMYDLGYEFPTVDQLVDDISRNYEGFENITSEEVKDELEYLGKEIIEESKRVSESRRFKKSKKLNEADSKQYRYTGTLVYRGKEYPITTVVNGKSDKDALKNVKVQFLKNHNIDFKYVGLVKLDPEVVEGVEELKEPVVDDNNSYMYMGYYIKETPYGYEVYNGSEKLQGELATDAEARAYIQSLAESKVRLDKSKVINEMPRLPHLTDKIIDELDKKAKLLVKRKYGAEVADWVSVTRGSEGVVFSAELDYDEMDEIADALNVILNRHGFDTYFEAEYPGTWIAYIDPKFIDESADTFLSVDEFINWHDKEFHDPDFDSKLGAIYGIFAGNNCSEEDDVDVCYDSLSDAEKIKVTKIIKGE